MSSCGGIGVLPRVLNGKHIYIVCSREEPRAKWGRRDQPLPGWPLQFDILTTTGPRPSQSIHSYRIAPDDTIIRQVSLSNFKKCGPRIGKSIHFFYVHWTTCSTSSTEGVPTYEYMYKAWQSSTCKGTNYIGRHLSGHYLNVIVPMPNFVLRSSSGHNRAFWQDTLEGEF